MRLKKNKHEMTAKSRDLVKLIKNIDQLPHGLGQLISLIAVVCDDVCNERDSYISIGGTRKRDGLLLTIQLDGERAAEGIGSLEDLPDALAALLSD